MDKYPSIETLLANEPPDAFRIEFRSGLPDFIIIAPHGGNIEPGTSELASHIAGDEHSYYSFMGLKAKGNQGLHITSDRFDETKALEMVAAAQTAVTIHGAKEDAPAIYIGGLNRPLIAALSAEINRVGFPVSTRVPTRFGGERPGNICNKCRSKRGVQLEITHGVRLKMFKNLSRRGRKTPTELFHTFVSIVRHVLNHS